MRNKDFKPVPPLTPAQRRAALDHYGRRCHFKGCQSVDDIEVDHIIPRTLGGTNEMRNLRPMCALHHSEKTNRKDIPNISRAKRLNDKHFGEKKSSGAPKIKSPGFNKSVSRGMDGKLRPRKKSLKSI